MSLRALLIAFALISLTGCTWVAPDSAGSRVAVVYDGPPAGCTRVGEISTSVAFRVAGIERSRTKVRDELESLARNEAVSLGADTIQPITEPFEGSQRFAAWRCR